MPERVEPLHLRQRTQHQGAHFLIESNFSRSLIACFPGKGRIHFRSVPGKFRTFQLDDQQPVECALGAGNGSIAGNHFAIIGSDFPDLCNRRAHQPGSALSFRPDLDPQFACLSRTFNGVFGSKAR